MQLSAGAAVLLLGFALYSLVRPEPIFALPAPWHHPNVFPGLARGAGSVPTFLHVLALALLSAGAVGGRRRAWAAPAFWAAVNVVFELGQHAYMRARFAALPELDHWLLERARSYFVSGTFDVADIVAACVGALTACAVIRLTTRLGDHR
jgi:hypothetical protein